MEKPVAAIEFGSTKLKLVVGYEIDGQVYVIYAITKPYGHIVELNDFLDVSKLIESVKEIKDFSDSSVKLSLSISEALLCLPPYNLDIFQTTQVTTIISEQNKVQNIDIKNIYALIRNGVDKISSEIFDVVPEVFVLDQGRSFTKAPINEVSNTLTVHAKIHALPKGVNKSYQNILNASGISCKRSIVAPFAAVELLATYEDLPSEYILVDIGSHVSTVSFVGNKKLFSSKYFSWGGNNITSRIVENFNISESEAEKIKVQYGLDERKMSFDAPVCRYVTTDGEKIKHSTDELNTIIKEELDIFVNELNSAIESLLRDYNEETKHIDLVLIGGGSALKGMKDYISTKVKNDNVHVVVPRALGARNGTYANCLGMILANAKYPCIFDDGHPHINNITRLDKKGE